MAASNKTIQNVIAVLLEHLTLDKSIAIVNDLRHLEGSRSFVDTIAFLEVELKLLKRGRVK